MNQYLLSVLCPIDNRIETKLKWITLAAGGTATLIDLNIVINSDRYIEYSYISKAQLELAVDNISKLPFSTAITPLYLSDDGSWQVLAL